MTIAGVTRRLQREWLKQSKSIAFGHSFFMRAYLIVVVMFRRKCYGSFTIVLRGPKVGQYFGAIEIERI